MKAASLLAAALALTGCAYRYGAGYFIANDKKLPEPEDYPMTIPSSPPPATSAVPPCPEEAPGCTTLEPVGQPGPHG